MVHDLIIIGAGAAGLFAGASLPSRVNGLIIEKSSRPGLKILMSGSGQCNLTHGGSIKDFISHYGKNGSKIRSILYQFNNKSVMEFFEKKGVPLFEREDEKIFPKSLKARDILDVLVKACTDNGLTFIYSSPVTEILYEKNCDNVLSLSEFPVYTVKCEGLTYQTKKLIIATGGCSYPSTGSDGRLFSVINSLGILVVPVKPALVPFYVKNYPYKELSGISFPDAKITLFNSKKEKIAENRDSILFTHTSFSGPGILNLSRYADISDGISINYYPAKSKDTLLQELNLIIHQSKKLFITDIDFYFNKDKSIEAVSIPFRFLESCCRRSDIEPDQKSSQLTQTALKMMIQFITNDTFTISKLGGFETAMATAGGVSLDEIDSKTLEVKGYPNLYFAGEVLNVDGDTGGYNLQFAFSSGYLAAQQ